MIEVTTALSAVARALGLLPPTPSESAVDALLRHDAHFEATRFWEEGTELGAFVGVQGVIDATNQMTWFGRKNDKNQVVYDGVPPAILAFRDALLRAVQMMRGSRATKQMKPLALLGCALAPLGLKLDVVKTPKMATASGGKCELISVVTIVEDSLDKLGVSLADAFGIYCREVGFGMLRSDEYRTKCTERARLEEYERSPSSGSDSPRPPNPRPSKAPRLLSNLAPEERFDGARRRFETYDANAVATLLADLRDDAEHRQRTLGAIDAAIQEEVKAGRVDDARCAQLEMWQRKLWRGKDLHAMVEAIATLPVANGCHGQWVEYEKDGLGRRYARGELTAPRVQSSKLSRLPSADALDPELSAVGAHRRPHCRVPVNAARPARAPRRRAPLRRRHGQGVRLDRVEPRVPVGVPRGDNDARRRVRERRRELAGGRDGAPRLLQGVGQGAHAGGALR